MKFMYSIYEYNEKEHKWLSKTGLRGEEEIENVCVFPLSAESRTARQGWIAYKCFDMDVYKIVCLAPDADSFFSGLYAREDVWPLLCNAHARRKFEAITKTTQLEGLAHEAMCFYSQLYNTKKGQKEIIIPTSKSSKQGSSHRYLPGQ